MGAGKSTVVKVNFNHSDSFYYAGEKVTGTVSFHNPEKKLTLTNVSLGFIGEVGYTGEKRHHSRDGMGNIHEEHRTGQHQVPFINIRIQFTQSKANENKISLEPGQYSWPFEFTIPQNLPPSAGSLPGSYPYIKYYVRITGDQPWYKSSQKETYPLTIFPNVNIFNNEERQSIVVSHRHRNHIHFDACLSPQSILPGEEFSLDIDLKNHKRLKIKGIEAILIQHREIDQNHHAEAIFKMDLPFPENFSDTELHENFNIRMPSEHIPPTYYYMISSSDLSIRTNIHYELKLEVKVHEGHHHMNLIIPVIIGTESSLYQSQLGAISYNKMPISYTTVVKETDASPVYELEVENLRL
ncbi:unnamed protein product [Rotaria sp. Silwood1]|nr:unnamed protein product [Rotaria sp. Silwood1]CAF0842402.1 unnamed protein product [Rotaria sp. Silwood1]CAF0953591.1 unnamed protein product [Rotaria sp. Silwood1]CAF3378159.1 unnamed protein product [Rotaria sp. Silwood1]CAF3402052.1 unnamed protein product [Rotaria sp. Silwood1]